MRRGLDLYPVRIVFVCALLLFAVSAFASDFDVINERADELFDKGDYAAAAAKYSEAYARGSGWAMLRLGYMHEYGLGVSADLKKAFDFYEKSAAAKEYGAF